MDPRKQHYQDVIRVLQGIIDKPDLHGYRGLCDTLFDYGCDSSIVSDVAQCWPKSSGCPDYPVPCPEDRDVGAAFHEAETEGTLYTGDYGKLRLELAQFIIDYCEQKLRGLGDNYGTK